MCLSFSPSCNEILPRVYLGNLSAATSNELLQKNAITHVLSVCNDYPSKGDDANHLTIGVEDTEYTDLLIHLPKACAWIQAALDTSGRVLVHCMMGVSRSATVVAAYLMKSRQISASAALRLIKQKRPQIHPNYGFLKQLDVWAECAYALSPTNTVYTSWKQKQNKTITGFLNYVHDTIPIIKDQLYLSSDFPVDVKQGDCLLKEWGITHVLSISPSKIVQPVLSSVTHLHVHAGHDARPDFLLTLPDACRFIKNAIDSKGLVLVHCSRECTACIVVCAYLMRSRNLTLLEAQSILEDALPLFSAPANFIRHLEAFASCECSPTTEHPVVKTWTGLPSAPYQRERAKVNITSVSTMTATASALLSETGIDLGAFGDTLAAIQTASLIIQA